MVLVGLLVTVFSAYMLIDAVAKRRQLAELVEQTRMLRESIAYDHTWQVDHDRRFSEIERAIQESVNRKELLIRAALKRQYGWTDGEIEAAIEAEDKSHHSQP